VCSESNSPTIPPSENWHYANFFQVAVTAQEVVIDFGQHFEGSDGPRWHTRIVLAPRGAQELLNVLARALNIAENPPVQ
jgi:hypothetical protein